MLTFFAEVKSFGHLCSNWTAHCEDCPRNGLGFIHSISSNMCQVLKKLASKVIAVDEMEWEAAFAILKYCLLVRIPQNEIWFWSQDYVS